jgi:hypothetical protein
MEGTIISSISVRQSEEIGYAYTTTAINLPFPVYCETQLRRLLTCPPKFSPAIS